MSAIDWLRNLFLAPLSEMVRSELAYPVTVDSGADEATGSILLERAPCDLAALLCQALRPLLAQSAAREIGLLIMPAADFPAVVPVDGLKLAWAMTTLVGTALRFVRRGNRMMPGGTIRVKIAWDAGKSTAVLGVEDDGDGIPPEALKNLLSRDVAPGRIPSLNFLLVEDIVRAHGGSLSITSPCSEFISGTSVTLRIPCGIQKAA